MKNYNLFSELELCNYWFEVRNEYPELLDAVLKVLLPFVSSYNVRDDGAFPISLLKI